MRFVLAIFILLFLTRPASSEEITVRELGHAVRYLIELYQQVQKENRQLKERVNELEKKLVLLKMELSLLKGRETSKASERSMTTMKNTPIVEIVPGTVGNPYPWLTFRRSDVSCTLPKKTARGYVYYNVIITRSKEKAINIARNIARAGLCTVVRRITKPTEKKKLYRVVVIPDKAGKWKQVLNSLKLQSYPYIRNLDLTRSSGGEI